MRCIGKENETIYTFEMTQTEQLILLGLLSKVIDGEQVKLDEKATKKIQEIANSLRVI
ncbi:hypothetical protein [Heyndrickxia camelliae]|uniref:hypothetical protein n=1 Tax=Heyndrickxia camelliae TaxID=1707093 RepID=UPI0013FDAF1F|nr:hypothetical protein [Heyndrickxia camelliae]